MNRAVLALSLLMLGVPHAFADDLKSETRAVAPFTAIRLQGAAKIDVEVGPAQSLVVEAKPETLDHVTTRVTDSSLVIDDKDEAWWQLGNRGPILVHIKVPTLSGFTLAGAGEATISGLKGGPASFTIAGAGRLEGSGTLDALNLSLDGAGSADFAKVAASSATVAVNGTGSAEVNAVHDLTATVNGVGSITYDGQPEHVSTAINGVGSIHQRK